MEAGAKRAALIWPRRAGKDVCSLAWSAFDLLRGEAKQVWHLFPEAAQARKALWLGIQPDGRRILDVAFPRAVRKSTNESEMRIDFVNGSVWMLAGSDRYDALIGSSPGGVVFSEFSTSNPRAYDYVRPILAHNGGWALFPTTQRGRNHLFELYQKLLADPASFAEVLTTDDTGHMTAEALELERREMSSELFDQEYRGSWDFGVAGSFYSKYMNEAMQDGRVCSVPYNQALPVWVAWDIGLRDSTALWFFQIEPGGRPCFIDYYEAHGEQLKHYVDLLDSKPYTYGRELILPHDAGHERLGMESIDRQLTALGWLNRVLPVEKSVLPGIEACRVAIGRAVFDEERTRQGRACLSAYKREYDDKRQVFRPTPLHDWASDGADSFRYAVRAINAGYCSTQRWQQVDYGTLNRAAI